MAQFDPETVKAIVTASAGSTIGTVLRAIIRPEENLKIWIAQNTAAIIVGTMIGLVATEWFSLEKFAGLASASVGALLSEQIISFLLKRGDTLKKGKIDLSIKGE